MRDGGKYADIGLDRERPTAGVDDLAAELVEWLATPADDRDRGPRRDPRRLPGGDAASAFVSADPGASARRFLPQIEPVLPGVARLWNGKAVLDAWLGNPWSRGAYAYWRVGQTSRVT